VNRTYVIENIEFGRSALLVSRATGSGLFGSDDLCRDLECATRLSSCAMSLVRPRAFLLLQAVLVLGSLAAAGLSADAAERPSARGTGILAEIDKATTDLFERISPSVVEVTTLIEQTEEKSRTNSGSGFFWDARGNIVTNAHLLQNAKAIMVVLASGEQFEAELVGSAPVFDLAVIRAKGLKRPPIPMERGSSGSLKIGQWVFAVGHPFGLDQSLTTGVVSALERELPTAKGRAIRSVIQTDAAIYPGSSGGPLVDSSGRLIGVNTVAYSTPDIRIALGFAIPVDLVSRIVPQLIQYGRVPTPGIGIVPAEEAAVSGLLVEGVMVGRVIPGSPAERAHLRGIDQGTKQAGDIIIAANGRTVTDVFGLTEQLDLRGLGRTIRISLRRDGGTIELDLEIVDIDRLTTDTSDKTQEMTAR
jgi:S1-C subfamily serine protease